MSDDDEPREVTYCGEATTGENKSCFFVLKGDIPLLTYLTETYCLIKTNKAKLFDLQCRAFGHFGKLVHGYGVILVPIFTCSLSIWCCFALFCVCVFVGKTLALFKTKRKFYYGKVTHFPLS